MTPIYKWQLGIGGIFSDVHPVYGDDLKLDYKMENNQRFFRGELSEKMVFVGSEAKEIIDAAFYTEFVVKLLMSIDYGQTWTLYHTSHFYKTDCTINIEDKTVEVKPSVNDSYEAVLNGLDKEFDLIKLKPVIQPLKAEKRPMFQFWASGENVVSCVSGGSSFETDTIDESDDKASACHFGNFSNMVSIQLDTDLEGLTAPFTGFYNLWEPTTFYNQSNIYKITYEGTMYAMVLRIIKISNNEEYWVSASMDSSIPSNLHFSPSLSFLEDIRGTSTINSFYGRLVTDCPELEIDGQMTSLNRIGTDDMVAYNRNYRYCVRLGNDFDIATSQRVTTEPTEWGLMETGIYYLPPDDTGNWYPIGKSQWGETSMWIKYDYGYQYWENTATKEYYIKDTFPIWSVIKVLLAEIAPNITHENSAAYSNWLYGGQHSLLYNSMIFMSPKSNIIAGEYQEPAMKAPVTLKKVLDMLRNALACYWFIDENNRLRIEHISYFKNGRSYTGTPQISFDLTAMENVRNGKTWALQTSKYSFDKEAMPARYEYSWMDECTDIFNGEPIEVVSDFVEEGKVEDISISDFTSDLDYMLLAPENCSKDGFALLEATLSGSEYSINSVNTVIDNYTYRIQNYKLSMWFLQQYYLDYDMPSYNIKVNGVAVTAHDIQRNKKQEVYIPLGDGDLDFMKLIRTGIGDGMIEQVSLNLSSRMAKVTLKYKTYEL